MIAKIRSFLFENKTARQTVTKNTFWLAVSQLGSRLIRAAIIIYAARILGASEYGVFSYTLGLAGFFTLFADIGIIQLLTRETASHPENRQTYFTNSFWLKSLLLLFTVLLVVFVAPHFSNIQEAAALIPLVALLVIFDGVREFSIGYLRGLEKMEWEALIVTFMNVAIAVAGFIILQFSASAHALFYAYITSVGTAALLSAIILRKQFIQIFKSVDVQLMKKIAASAWPIAFAGMLGIFMLNTDIIMLGWWRSAQEIGYYSAGQRIVQVLYTIPALFASGIFPILSRFITRGEQERERELNEKSFSFAYMVAIPLVTGGIILARPIIELVFGAEYLPTVPAFQILIATLLITFPTILLSNLVIAHNQQRRTFWFMGVGSLGNVFFNALLIPPFGIIGSSVATIGAQLLNTTLIWRYMKRVIQFSVLPRLLKIIAASALMGAFSLLANALGVHVLITIALSAILYFAVLWVAKDKTFSEAKSIVPLLNRL